MYDNMRESQRITYLISGSINNNLTIQEKAELENWLAEKQKNRQIFDQLTDEVYRSNVLKQWRLEAAESSLKRVKDKMTKQKKIVLWPQYVAAASLLLGISFGAYFLLHKQTAHQIAQNQIHNDVAPGGNKAILTLSNGKQISLNDAKKGILLREDNEFIKKTSDDMVSYEDKSLSGTNQPLTYNTVTTPRGGQWSVLLPDGTKVMLDAASSIKFPVSFTGNERKVEITGQAYFEVVHNAAKPFRVITKSQVIEDIGTKFNINAYDDESVITTTLLEGAVKISEPNAPSSLEQAGVMLKPGQQTTLQNNKFTVSDANTDEAFAWKNGYFNLNDEKIKSIMHKLSRWYDIEVEYKGDLPDRVFGGEIPRNAPLSQILKILGDANVHFTVEEKKIIITP
jgi:transmembrane sensor